MAELAPGRLMLRERVSVGTLQEIDRSDFFLSKLVFLLF